MLLLFPVVFLMQGHRSLVLIQNILMLIRPSPIDKNAVMDFLLLYSHCLHGFHGFVQKVMHDGADSGFELEPVDGGTGLVEGV